tara:strand:- start:754 stop:924 length:171 start_codon:yes stop_codon:yes gene_type:complete
MNIGRRYPLDEPRAGFRRGAFYYVVKIFNVAPHIENSPNYIKSLPMGVWSLCIGNK